ncbi:MAG TPA: DNA double-strand break repair nuclease NurA [Euryarchaeota archaeon]|nr:nurA domain protein [archaeon BMS3Bbin16]HDH27514.1 DNA double-strand break repair nuclease NurA [Euryarchaeota archaeon]
MLDLTYEVLAREKGGIQKQVSELLDRSIVKDYRARWNSMSFKPSPSIVGAEDGSINHKRYKNLVIYAVNATAIVYDGDIRSASSADVGVLYPYFQIEERLHLYRAIYEFKCALEVIDSVDLFLVDGSMMSDLNAFRRLSQGVSKEQRAEVFALLPMLEQAEGVGITSIELSRRLESEEYREKRVFLEYLEYLSTLEKLLSRGLDKLVGISKLSTRSRLGIGVPDLAVFDEATSQAGYSDPETDVVTRRFPVYDELFRSLVFTISNIRLEDGKDVYMLEVPREIDKSQLIELLEKISYTSVDGYPYLLKKAHKDVVIRNSDMDRIAGGLGIIEKTGREVLK